MPHGWITRRGTALLLASLPVTVGAVRAAAAPETIASTAPAGGVVLNTGLTRLILSGRMPVADMLDALPPGRGLFLVLSDLHAKTAPGVIYDLYLDLPPGAAPHAGWPGYVASLNFFGAPQGPRADRPRRVSYDVTNALERLRGRRVLSRDLTLTIVPEQPPDPEAQPAIGRIDLVVQ